MELTSILMTALNAVLPIILLIFLGYFLRRKEFLTENFLAVGNKLVFKLMLPSMLFINIYKLDSLADVQWDVTVYALAAILLISLGTAISLPRRSTMVWVSALAFAAPSPPQAARVISMVSSSASANPRLMFVFI